MAQKTTYIYRVDMGTNGTVLGKEFCYARNSDIALEEYKKLHPEYDTFHFTLLGYANERKHPDPFEVMPSDEQEYLHKTRCEVGVKYAMQRKPSISFVKAGERESL